MLPPNINPGLKNAAAVMITAELPPFAKPGQRLDVTVSALGKAKSLRGGTLLLAPMQGADGELYALAQGNLAVGGFGAEGKDGSKIVVGTPSSGRIPGGASVERSVPSPFAGDAALRLDLNEQDFSAARSVTDAINTALGGLAATTLDAATIAIRAPADRIFLVDEPSNFRNIEWVSPDDYFHNQTNHSFLTFQSQKLFSASKETFFG